MNPRPLKNWLATAICCLALTGVAQAQASRTWVSGVGDDANPCSRTAPCKTFAGAISKTAAGGEISVLDPGGFGAVTITKSITINGTGTLAGILASGTNGVIINALATDTVTLRNISIVGFGTGLNGIRVLAVGNLHIENVEISGFAQKGIDISSSVNTNFYIKESVISNCNNAVNGGAILVKPGAGVTTNGFMDTVKMEQSLYGIRVEDRGNVTANNSIVTSNANNGFLAISTTVAATLNLDKCIASNQLNAGVTAAGINAAGNLATINMSNCSIFNNNFGINFSGGGDVISFGNNRNTGNGTNNAPTATILQQ